jgi:transcriptional regulator with XRE-family HTH domain
MVAIGLVSKSGYSPEMGKSRTPVVTRRSGAKPRARGPGRVYPNRIAELARARDLTYAGLADRVKAHEVTIANLATGAQQLTQEWMIRLGEALDVPPEEIISRPAAEGMRRVRVRAWLEASDWAETHEWPDADQYDVVIPDDPSLRSASLYAAEIRGQSMNLRYPARSVVVFSRIVGRPNEVAAGKRYHVRRTRVDGLTEETVKTLVRDEQGRYWLKPESSDPEHQACIALVGDKEATVEAIGRVRFVVHRED